MLSFSKFEHTNYTKSPFTYTEPLSCDCKVTVNGTQIPVYTCRISQNPINSYYPGYQRPIIQTELVSFVNLVSDEVLEFEVEILKNFSKKTEQKTLDRFGEFCYNPMLPHYVSGKSLLQVMKT